MSEFDTAAVNRSISGRQVSHLSLYSLDQIDNRSRDPTYSSILQYFVFSATDIEAAVVTAVVFVFVEFFFVFTAVS